MVRKPGKMYRQIKGMAYCRKEYMGGIPALRIVRFDIGVKADVFPVKLTLIAKEQCQIRHTAMEAARVAATRWMEKTAGASNFHLKVRVYPHVVLREHKTATGAGADRISEGMSHAFGTAVGTAARVQPGYQIISIWTATEFIDIAKRALIRAGQKLPTPISIIVEKNEKFKAS
jgi:large subunit ribosomal protein L10e